MREFDKIYSTPYMNVSRDYSGFYIDKYSNK